ncbi:MAG: hypothetical protein ACTSXP_13615, partial [Promethearchaeota archaeon]
MGVAKNLGFGILYSLIAATSYIILPYIGIQTIKNLDIEGVGRINYGRERVDTIIFYMVFVGLILVALGFAKGSSPKYSKRRAVFNLLYLLGGGLYTFIVRFAGLSNVPIVLKDPFTNQP